MAEVLTPETASVDDGKWFKGKRIILPVAALLLIGGCSAVTCEETESPEASVSASAQEERGEEKVERELAEKKAEEAKASEKVAKAAEREREEAEAAAAREAAEAEQAAADAEVEKTKAHLLGADGGSVPRPSWAQRFQAIESPGGGGWKVEVAGPSSEMTDDLLLEMGRGFRNFMQQAGAEVGTVTFTDHQGIVHNVYCGLGGDCRTSLF